MRRQVEIVERFDRFSDLAMKLHTPRRREPVVERVSDEPVAEPKAPDRPSYLLDDTLQDGLIQDADEFFDRHPGDSRNQVQVELPADDRGRSQQVVTASRKPLDPSCDHRANAGWNAWTRVSFTDAVLGIEQTDEFADKERVAFGLTLDRLNELLRGLNSGARVDVVGDILLTETGEVDLGHGWFANKLCESSPDWFGWRRIDVAEGADEQEPRRPDLAGDEAQQKKGGFIRGMQVVEDEHDWALFCRGE